MIIEHLLLRKGHLRKGHLMVFMGFVVAVLAVMTVVMLTNIVLRVRLLATAYSLSFKGVLIKSV